MPNDDRLRDIWVDASEALYDHRANRGIHGHEDPTLPNMPTPLRALLRRSRTELGHEGHDVDLGLGS